MIGSLKMTTFRKLPTNKPITKTSAGKNGGCSIMPAVLPRKEIAQL